MAKVELYRSNPERWAQEVAEQYPDGGTGRVLIVSDVDDTLLDSSLRWYEDYKRRAKAQGFDNGELRSVEIFRRLGPRNALTELGIGKDYPKYKRKRMHSIEFHRNMSAFGDAKTVLSGLATRRVPAAYLSTRPVVLGRVTRQNLSGLGLSRAPLLLRPDHVPYDQTIGFKVAALKFLRRAIQGPVIHYIDDYKGVTNAVNNLQDSHIVGVHFGPHTSWRRIVSQLLRGEPRT